MIFFWYRWLESILVVLVRALLIIVPLLPERFLHRIADTLARLTVYTAHHSRLTAERTLAVVAPPRSPEQTAEIITEHFGHQYRNMFELLRYQKLTRQKIMAGKVKFIGRIHLERALREGRGVILLAPHMGNWELLGATWALLGYDINSFFLDLRFRRLSEMLNRERRRSGIKLIGRNELKKSVKVLKNNGVLGILADQDGGGAGFAVPFFGRKVSFPAGPARLQRMTDAIVLPNLLLRNPDETYTMRVDPPLAMRRTLDRRRDEAVNSLRMARCYEAMIGLEPTQWLISYDRFKPRRHVDEVEDRLELFTERSNSDQGVKSGPQ